MKFSIDSHTLNPNGGTFVCLAWKVALEEPNNSQDTTDETDRVDYVRHDERRLAGFLLEKMQVSLSSQEESDDLDRVSKYVDAMRPYLYSMLRKAPNGIDCRSYRNSDVRVGYGA